MAEKQQIKESNLSSAMDFAFKRWIKPLDTENILDYRPKSQSDKVHFYNDRTTGIIFLKKHPNCKYAWLLVKFDENTDKKVGKHVTYTDNSVIRTKTDFQKFFGVEPMAGWKDDTVIYVRSGKNIVDNNPETAHDYQETAPYFYMYIDHSNVNPQVAVNRLYRINDILDVDENALIDGVYHITSKVKQANNVKQMLK